MESVGGRGVRWFKTEIIVDFDRSNENEGKPL